MMMSEQEKAIKLQTPIQSQQQFRFQNSQKNQTTSDSNSKLTQHDIIHQYYKYVSLLKRSDNIYQDVNRYKDIPESMFSNLTLIGSISELTTVKDQQNKDCISITMITTIKYPSYFLNNVTTQPTKILKKQGKQIINKQNIKRNLILLKQDYIKFYVKIFNKIVKDCKSNISVFQKMYFITGLEMQLLDNKAYFAITPNTYIGSLQNQLYMRVFNPLQRSLGFFYSYVHTNFPINKEDQGYSLQTFQSQFIQMEKVSFTGVVQNYYIYNQDKKYVHNTTHGSQQLQQKNVETNNHNVSKTQSQKVQNVPGFARHRDKQLVIQVLQQNFRGKIQMIGIAKIIYKFHPKDEQEVMSYLEAGKVYLFANMTLIISDNLAVNFKFQGKISNFITPLHKQANPSILPILQKANVFQLRSLNAPVLYRNIIKIEVSYVNCQFLFGKVICSKCTKIMNTREKCSQCGQDKGKLQLWAIVIVADQTAYAQISLQSQKVFDYFDFTEEELAEMRDLVFQQESKKMRRLFYYQSKFHQNNQKLQKFKKKLLFAFIEKTLVGTPKFNSNDSFKQLSIEQKQQFLTSFYTTKEYIKKNKVQFNGHTIRIDKQKKIVPFLKIMEVL